MYDAILPWESNLKTTHQFRNLTEKMSEGNYMDKLLRGGFRIKYIDHLWGKEPTIQAKSIVQKYKIGLICGDHKPLQLVTYRDKIVFPLLLQNTSYMKVISTYFFHHRMYRKKVMHQQHLCWLVNEVICVPYITTP